MRTESRKKPHSSKHEIKPQKKLRRGMPKPPVKEVSKPTRRERPNKSRGRKRTVYITVAAIVAIIIIAAVAVLRGVSEQRRYNEYMKQAQQSYYLSDYDNALTILRKAAAINGTDDCLLLMAACYETQGNYTKALEVLRTMDVQKPAVSSKIASIEARRKTLEAAEYVTVAGRQFPMGTTTLALDNMELADAALDEILQLYALDRLSLANNSLYDISKLSALGGLVYLDLSNNNISDIKALAGLTGLRTLCLDNNPITDLSAVCSLTNLTSLSIKGVPASEAQLEELISALPACAIHSETAQYDINDISFSGLTFNADVEELDLSGMEIHDISVLADCQKIKRLDLSNNDISDLSPLMNLPELEWLNISGNQIADLRPLMGIASLSCLNASDNNISSTSVFSMLNGLSELYLDGNPLCSFSGLKNLKLITTLSLSSTGVNDDALFELMELTSLKKLNIEDNADISGEAVDKLRQMIPACEIVHSDLAYLIWFDGAEVRSNETELSLADRGISDISGALMLNYLESADLSGNSITNIYPLGLSESRFSLLSLDLSGNGLVDITPLASLQRVEYLDLSDNDIHSELPLMRLFTLKTLVLTGNPLSEDQLQNLRDSLVDCEIVF